MRRAVRPLVLLCLALTAAAARPALAQQELSESLSRMPIVFGKSQFYQRRGAEDIYRIARRFGVSASAVNNANVGDLKAGDELLLIPTEHVAPLSIADGVVINLAERGLYLFREGVPIRYFPVAIGMRGWETPTGEFAIANKAKNPTWFPPAWALKEEPVPPGPDNPLGDRWMGLSARGYGIHATNAPWTVGHYSSHGCMRMYPEQAHQLFDLVRVGTSVTIVYQRVSFGYRRTPDAAAVYMAHFPDPYQLGDVGPDDVRKALTAFGLDAVIDMEAVAKALERPSGLPVAIVGSDVKLVVNGAAVHAALGPTKAGKDWLVPAGPLVQALKARMEMGAGAGYLVITRGTGRLFLSPGSDTMLINGQTVLLEVAPQLAAGYPLIPLRATVEALGATLESHENGRMLSVVDGLAMATPSDWTNAGL